MTTTTQITHQIIDKSELFSEIKTFPICVLLIDDQPLIGEMVRNMLEDQTDIAFHYCSDPSMALKMANEKKPTVILQDLVMPDIDGLMLVKYFRANNATKEVPLIVLSSKEDAKIKAEAFQFGANDYLVKLPDKVELLARIRYHSSSYVHLLERNLAYQKLKESQRILNAELFEASEYVKGLLPPPIKTPIQANWRYIPSTMLGGDSFGYHWLDDDHFVVYLLDVCGHGVGAALLSITIMNVLRSQTLPNTNFYEPSDVLYSLNKAFQMEEHNNMFFTMWYGVFNKINRNLVFASGGHPPAVLFNGDNKTNKIEPILLTTPGLVIGGMPEIKIVNQSCKVDKFNKFYLFSDGVYEIAKQDGSILTFEEFVKALSQPSKDGIEDVDRILQFSQSINTSGSFVDDFSLLQIIF